MKLYRVPPKSILTVLIGHKASNCGGTWYINGGTFCVRCEIAYNFEETHKIYNMNYEQGYRHGIPRCPVCHKSLRTKNRKRDKGGIKRSFWTIMKEMGELKD